MKLPENFSTDFPGLIQALEQTGPSLSVRFNTARGARIPENLERVPWCGNGVYLQSRPAFTFDPAMHQGMYYVQDASSMIHSHIVAEITAGREPLLCLDACAAPGGKTTATLDSLPHGSFILANEYVTARAESLNQNLLRWGNPMVAVSNGDTSRLRKFSSMFDIIVADVPCSGEGMFRKDPEAVRQWSPQLVADCAGLQKEITANLWEALKPGGYMIYSTCTFNRKENQEVVAHMLENFEGASAVDVEVPQQWGISKVGHCMHFLPGMVRGEGLTVAVLRKSAVPDMRMPKKNIEKQRSKAASVPQQVLQAASKWISGNDEYAIKQFGDIFYAQPKQWEQELNLFNMQLKMINPGGIGFAQIKGRDILPQQALALSCALLPRAFHQYDTDYPQAIAYLQRQSLQLNETAPRGVVLLTYRGAALGFVKNLGSRANNLYPPAWRILSTHVPEKAPEL